MGIQKAYTEILVDSYDYRHFGGKSGQLILQRDCRALESLLEPPSGPILDIPCGTGVYAMAYRRKGYGVVAADASVPMLELVGQREAELPRVLCDINHLPFREGSLDAVTTIRLFSHFSKDDMERGLLELARAIRPGGRVVFDTFRWTPRQWPVFRRFLDKGQIVVISPSAVEKMIETAGLSQVDARHLYLFSPILLRRLPYWLLRGLFLMEKLLPQRWLLRTFWACTKG